MNVQRSTVKLDLRPLQRLRRAISTGGTFGGKIVTVKGDSGGGGGAMREMYAEWGRRMLAFWRDQFRRNRGGGGDWPPLKPETARRHKDRIGILSVTLTLFNALRPGAPGNVFQVDAGGVAVGIGGSAKHPESNLTIGEIALIHHRGTPFCPKRTIFYPPDATLKRLMQDDARRTVQRILRQVSSN
jgi:hypothetical protein